MTESNPVESGCISVHVPLYITHIGHHHPPAMTHIWKKLLMLLMSVSARRFLLVAFLPHSYANKCRCFFIKAAISSHAVACLRHKWTKHGQLNFTKQTTFSCLATCFTPWLFFNVLPAKNARDLQSIGIVLWKKHVDAVFSAGTNGVVVRMPFDCTVCTVQSLATVGQN